MEREYLIKYKVLLDKLIKARRDAHLTQSEVSKIINKPQSYISKIENGERRIDVIELKILADIYHKDINCFLE